MENTNTTAETVPGTGEATTQAKQAITLENVKEWAKDDLARAISFLNAIHSDPDLLDSVAHFMYGRWANSQHKPEKP